MGTASVVLWIACSPRVWSVYHGSSLDRVKPNIIKLVFVSSQLKHAALWRKKMTGWFGISITCRGRATSLPADCYSIMLAL